MSPSAQRLSSSHQGVLSLSSSGTFNSSRSPHSSMSCTHFSQRLLMREVIQSKERTALCSSGSRHASSTSCRFENLSANELCWTDVRVDVRVVTAEETARSECGVSTSHDQYLGVVARRTVRCAGAEATGTPPASRRDLVTAGCKHEDSEKMAELEALFRSSKSSPSRSCARRARRRRAEYRG